ncbi:MAG: PIG-L family deacetylase [Acidobacteria bacterium]|nr:PIG-L family deacetylase [Acidobacteriota bacterium]
MANTLMAIAAHPGDAFFTMGGTVAQHIQNGGNGVFVSLTLGEKGAPANIPVERYGEMQRAASQEAAKMLGAEFELLTYPDAELPFKDQAALAVCDIIRQHKPDIVITHWSGSWHKDHQNCHLLVRDALFYAALKTMGRKDQPHTVRKLFYAENWEDADNFKPDTYLDISSVVEKWLKACDAYPMWRGQTGFFRYNDYYSSLAVMRGCLSGFRHAVALMSDPNERVSRVRTL